MFLAHPFARTTVEIKHMLPIQMKRGNYRMKNRGVVVAKTRPELLHKAGFPPCDGMHALCNQVVSEGLRQSKLGTCYEMLDIIAAGGLIPPPRINGRRRFVRTGRPKSAPMNQGLSRGSPRKNEAERGSNPRSDLPGLIEGWGDNLGIWVT